MKITFTPSAFRQLGKLDKDTQKKIIAKLEFYSSQPHPLKFAESLRGQLFGFWRFRVEDYRILFDVEKDKIIILKIGHRRDVYK